MTTGLFTHRHNLGATVWKRQQGKDNLSGETTLNRFADRLAEHGDCPRAAREIGASASYGRVLLGKIRKRLGWQAQ